MSQTEPNRTDRIYLPLSPEQEEAVDELGRDLYGEDPPPPGVMMSVQQPTRIGDLRFEEGDDDE